MLALVDASPAAALGELPSDASYVQGFGATLLMPSAADALRAEARSDAGFNALAKRCAELGSSITAGDLLAVQHGDGRALIAPGTADFGFVWCARRVDRPVVGAAVLPRALARLALLGASVLS